MMMTNVPLPSQLKEAEPPEAEAAPDEGPMPTKGRRFSKTVQGTPPQGIDLESALPDTREHAKLPGRGRFKKTMIGTMPPPVAPAAAESVAEPEPEPLAVAELVTETESATAAESATVAEPVIETESATVAEPESELDDLTLPTRNTGRTMILVALLSVLVALLLAWLSTQ